MPPRQLPWLKKGGPTKTQVKPAPRLSKHRRLLLGDDDDKFFEGTVLAPSRKGKLGTEASDSDHDLPELAPMLASPRKGKRQMQEQSSRAPSSSPPPVADVPPPTIEFMDGAASRFDLRDDEWMMVEDEFLQTAKLFTRHLHLAEYEQLKEIIRQKKDVARPVIPSVKPSEERQIKAKAETQLKAQKKALKDARSEEGHKALDNVLVPPNRTSSSKPPPPSFSGSTRTFSRTPSKPAVVSSRPKQKITTPDATDSEDLDAPKRTWKPSQIRGAKTSAKPLISPEKKEGVTARPIRRTPFDMLDDDPLPSPSKRTTTRSPQKSALDLLDQDFSPRRHSPSEITHISSMRPPSPTKPVQKHPQKQPSKSRPSQRATSSRPFDLLSELDFTPRDPMSKEQAERLTKRKAEREKEREREKKKSIKLDDIPTFLF